MKTEKDISKTGFYQYYPVVPAVIVVKSGDSIDALACAWYSAVSFDPPLFAVSIAPKRYSYQMLKKSREFTANFLEFDNVGTIAALGRTSGREIDKFSAYRIKTLPSTEIETPVLKEAYAAYECRIVKRHRIGDHDLFIGEVLAVHYKDKAFDKKTKLPSLSKLTPALYLGADHYAAIKSFTEVRIGKEDVMGKAMRQNEKKHNVE